MHQTEVAEIQGSIPGPDKQICVGFIALMLLRFCGTKPLLVMKCCHSFASYTSIH